MPDDEAGLGPAPEPSTAHIERDAEGMQTLPPQSRRVSVGGAVAAAAAALGGGHEGSRHINLGQEQSDSLKKRSNNIATSKYNVVTFLPKNLFEQYHRISNIYFTIVAALSWWEEVSPFDPFGSTAAIVFVLVVGMIKDGAEDYQRHVEDSKINNAKAVRVCRATGEEEEIKWRDVRVGDVVTVVDDEQIPADLLFLHSELEGGVCFIKTANLDGETNLKIKSAVPNTGVAMGPAGAAGADPHGGVTSLQGSLECEAPSASLTTFEGALTVTNAGEGGDEVRDLPVSIDNMLLRGCTIKNTGRVTGLVVYTGPESRIMMNAGEPPSKFSTFDKFINTQICILFLAQMVLVVGSAGGSVAWRNGNQDAYYLQLGENTDSDAAFFFKNCVTFFILYSYMIPISLVITMEIVKFLQANLLIDRDGGIYDATQDERARARTSNLNEDLGAIQFVFSDKTGTLTANDMQLRQVSVRGVKYGRVDFQLENTGQASVGEVRHAFDADLAKAAVTDEGEGEESSGGGGGGAAGNGGAAAAAAQQPPPPLVAQASSRVAVSISPGSRGDLTVDVSRIPHGESPAGAGRPRPTGPPSDLDRYMTLLALCQTILVEKDEASGAVHYQGSSPDEVALVSGAARLGWAFKARTSAEVVMSVEGEREDRTYGLLVALEFSSDRRKASVVVRDNASGEVVLYTKGADSAILERLSPPSGPGDSAALEATERHLDEFSMAGLRTLVTAYRVIPSEEFDAWNERYLEASRLLQGRAAAQDALADELEAGLTLLGATAIEDRLQDRVPETLTSLLKAEIKVWVITGDKQQTAINIGRSAGLLTGGIHDLVIFNADSKEGVQEIGRRAMDKAAAAGAAGIEMVIDGKTLAIVLADDELKNSFAEVGQQCRAVVVCRASPIQKALVVRLMKEKTGVIALAIGDGANDVPMIQEADIGVGIFGKEGRQAVNNSDYAIGQFRFLSKLLIVHGQQIRQRMARLIKYSFYKNIAFNFVLFWNQVFAGFSGQAPFGSVPSSLYNVVFAALPIGVVGVYDFNVSKAVLRRYPQLYHTHNSLSQWVFAKALLDGLISSVSAFYVPFWLFNFRDGKNAIADLDSVGNIAYTIILTIVSLELALDVKSWTAIFAATLGACYLSWYPFFNVYPYYYVDTRTGLTGEGVAAHVFVDARFYFSVMLAASFTSTYRLCYIWFHRQVKPEDEDIIREHELLHPEMYEDTEPDDMIYFGSSIDSSAEDSKDGEGGNGAAQQGAEKEDAQSMDTATSRRRAPPAPPEA